MASESMSCWAFYAGWEEYQRLMVGAVAPLTDADLQRSIASDLRPIGMLATHSVRTRAAWLHGVLGEGRPEVAAIAACDDNAGDAPPAAEIVRGLKVTFAAWAEEACDEVRLPRRQPGEAPGTALRAADGVLLFEGALEGGPVPFELLAHDASHQRLHQPHESLGAGGQGSPQARACSLGRQQHGVVELHNA